jgi:hypothetical protein
LRRALSVQSPLAMNRPVAALLVLASLSGRAFAAEEPQNPWPWHRAAISVGGFLANNDTQVELTEDSTGSGLIIDLEDALNLEGSSSAFRVGGYYRLGESMRHRLALEYYGFRSSASKVLENDVEINDTTYPAGTELSIDTSFDLFKLSYAYSFVFDERVDIAATFGIYTMPFSLEFSGLTTSESQDVVAPLPVIGIQADIALEPNLFLRQRLDLFYLEVSGFKGAMLDAYLGLEWLPWEHVGLGLGYNSFNLSLEVESDPSIDVGLTGSARYTRSGLLLYLTYAF